MARRRKSEALPLGGAPGGPAPCEHCGYNLIGLDTLGPCPECGKTPTCIACGYDLASIVATANCPECGLPASSTLRGDLASVASPQAIKAMHQGLILVQTGVAAALVFTIIGVVLAVVYTSMTPSDVWTTWDTVSTLINGAISLVYLGGYWLLSRFRTPDGPGASTLGPSRAMRAGVIVTLAAIILSGLYNAFAFNAAQLSDEAFSAASLAWTYVLSLTSLTALGLLYFGSLAFVGAVAMRLPDRRLRKRARRLVWLGPTIAILGLVLFYLGPLIALVMYWNTLDRLRKAVKRVRGAMQRAQLEGG